jgi:type II secretory pathway component PulK
VVVIMTIMAYSILYEANLSVDLTKQFRDRFYAMVLARAGVGRAAVDLSNDLRLDIANRGEGPIIDAKGDPWAREDEDYTDVQLDHGTFTVRVIDENRFLPVNFRSSSGIKYLLEMLGLDDDEELDNASSAVKDYVDPDDEPSMEEKPADSENRAYEKLIEEDLRMARNERATYVNKNDQMQTKDELLSIYGISDHLFFGSAWPEDDEDDRLKWRRPRYYDRIDKPRDYKPGLRDLVTVYPILGVNINTMEPEVAHALFSIASDSIKDGEDNAKRLLDKRPEPRGDRRPRNDNAFGSRTDLPGAGISVNAVNGAQQGTFLLARSNIFRIESVGKVRDTEYKIEVILNREWDSISRDESRGSGNNRRRRATRDDDEQLAEMPALRVLEWREY